MTASYEVLKPDMAAGGALSDEIRLWLDRQLPDDWFEGPVEVTVDREEVTVVGRIPAPTAQQRDVGHEAELKNAITAFRDGTLERRSEIARVLERVSGRKVAWGVDCGDRREIFSRLAAPVMTRLRQPERQVLDTLVDAGVARSRSEALAWCVKLVGTKADTWLADLRRALVQVEEVRAAGPGAQP